MNTRSHTLYVQGAPWTQTMKMLAAHVRALCGGVLAYFAAASRRAAHRRELEALSDAELHDLGLHRSEIDSCWAESAGMAQATRRRLLYFLPR